MLDGLEEIRICTGYQLSDGVAGTPRFASEYYADIQPVYESLPGWQESTLGIKSVAALPENARAYLKLAVELVQFFESRESAAESVADRGHTGTGGGI